MAIVTIATVAPIVACAAAESASYRIESRTIMPHLDEMRRISKTERLCVPAETTEAFFPVMRQPALRGCALVETAPGISDGTRRFTLRCETELVATGTAELETAARHVRGALDVKMGGKNMTFSQTVIAERLGPCADSPAVVQAR